MEAKKFTYFPSLSAGSFRSALTKDKHFADGTTVKFFNQEYPEQWRHPYFLITAGHAYSKPEFRKDMGLDDNVLVFGDSGGFQIATGALKWDTTIREKIFHWLEHNADIAANIDIPPRFTYAGQYHHAKQLSLENFKWFEKNQTGKTKFLNILQGTNTNEYDDWYNDFKDFEFQGWGIGGIRQFTNFMYSVALLLKERAFEKKNVEYVHFLGISKISDFFILATLQKLMNKLTDNRVLVTTDSSSPGQYPVYGTYLHSYNLKGGIFTDLYLPKNGKYRKKTHINKGNNDLFVDPNQHIPCSLGCPACKDFTYDLLSGLNDEGLDRYTQEAMTRMVVHNTHLYVDLQHKVNDLVDSHIELLETFVSKDLYDILNSMHEMFADPDSAIEVFKRYRKTYSKFGGEGQATVNSNILNQFFN